MTTVGSGFWTAQVAVGKVGDSPIPAHSDRYLAAAEAAMRGGAGVWAACDEGRRT